MQYELVPFTRDRADKVIGFALEKPWHQAWPRELVRRFLLDLTSKHDFVFDLFEGPKRVAVAVLLDKLQNMGNNAPLEILRLDGLDSPAILSQILGLAKDLLPANRSGIEIAIPASFENREALLSIHQLELYYQTFEMLNENVLEDTETPSEITGFTAVEYPDLYRVLVESFSENIETAVPPFDEWRASRMRSQDSMTWVWREAEAIVGFLILKLPANETPELHMVGVLSEHRKKGIGEKLIRNCLRELTLRGNKACSLTVAAKNAKALQLYKKLGFKEIESKQTYRWKRPD